jgi:hypothetical protein
MIGPAGRASAPHLGRAKVDLPPDVLDVDGIWLISWLEAVDCSGDAGALVGFGRGLPFKWKRKPYLYASGVHL